MRYIVTHHFTGSYTVNVALEKKVYVYLFSFGDDNDGQVILHDRTKNRDYIQYVPDFVRFLNERIKKGLQLAGMYESSIDFVEIP